MTKFFRVIGHAVTEEMYKEPEDFESMSYLLELYFPLGTLVVKSRPVFGEIYFEKINPSTKAGGIVKTEVHTLSVEALTQEEMQMYDMVNPGMFK